MLIPLEEAHALIERHFTKRVRTRRVKVWEALGKVLAEDVISPIDVPERPLSAMDGFAVRAEDLEKYASLRITGKSFPSAKELRELGEGEAFYVTTGAPLPPGANAVVRIEAAKVEGEFVKTSVKVAPGKDVRPAGEDFKRGDLLLQAGRVVNERDLALLLRAGIEEIEVLDYSSCVLATGDELAPYDSPQPGKVRDSIAPTVLGYLSKFGNSLYFGVVPDDENRILNSIELATSTCDLVFVVGGSSVGEKDYVKRAISKLGTLLFEGVSVNVVKRCGVGQVNGKPVVSLPGQVVSSVTSFHEFGLHVLEALSGVRLRRSVTVELEREVEVRHNMDSVYLFRIEEGRAVPLRWGVGLYRELSRADGYAVLKKGITYRKGERVEVRKFL